MFWNGAIVENSFSSGQTKWHVSNSCTNCHNSQTSNCHITKLSWGNQTRQISRIDVSTVQLMCGTCMNAVSFDEDMGVDNWVMSLLFVHSIYRKNHLETNNSLFPL